MLFNLLSYFKSKWYWIVLVFYMFKLSTQVELGKHLRPGSDCVLNKVCFS